MLNVVSPTNSNKIVVSFFEVDVFENAYYRVSGNDEKSNCKYTMALHTGDGNGNVISTGTDKAVTTYTKNRKNYVRGFPHLG